MKSERVTTIQAPVSEVFSYVADLTRHPEWAQHPLRIEQTSEGAVGVGTTFSSGHADKELKDRVKIVEFEQDGAIVFDVEGSQGHYSHAFLLQEQNGQPN